MRRYRKNAEFELGPWKFLAGNERCPFPCPSVTYCVYRWHIFTNGGTRKEVETHRHRQPVTGAYSDANLCNRNKAQTKISGPTEFVRSSLTAFII